MSIFAGSMRMAPPFFIAVVTLALAGPPLSSAPSSPPSVKPVSPATVAYQFAPVFVQETTQRTGNGKEYEDFFTRVDYDGDANGFNNWESVGASPTPDLRAFVYGAVRETDNNYYLHYAYFHPRDPKAKFWHENDFEGAMVIVRKRTDGAASTGTDIALVQAQAHNRWDYADLGNSCVLGDGEPLTKAQCKSAGAPGNTHVVLFSQPGRKNWWLLSNGHGTKIPSKIKFSSSRIVYVPWTATGQAPASSAAAGDPRANPGAPVTYALLPLTGDVDGDSMLDGIGAFGDKAEPGLWDRRRDVRIFGLADPPGRALQGDDDCRANAPWGWTGSGDPEPGMFFLRPAEAEAWRELRARGITEVEHAVFRPDPFWKPSDLKLFPPSPRPLECDCTAMRRAFDDSNAGPNPADPLPAGPRCMTAAGAVGALATRTIERWDWDTCRELREWVAPDAQELVKSTADESSKGCALQVPGDLMLRWPGETDDEPRRGSPGLRLPSDEPISSVRVKARAPKGGVTLGGYFLQAGVAYGDSLGAVPKFLPIALGRDWTSATLWLNGSPYVSPETAPAVFVIGPDPSEALVPGHPAEVPPAGAWEVDRITVISEKEAPAPLREKPLLESVPRSPVNYGEKVTITGSGFSERCPFNVVLLDGVPQHVVKCTKTSLSFEARKLGSSRLAIRTAGGTTAGAAGDEPVLVVR